MQYIIQMTETEAIGFLQNHGNLCIGIINHEKCIPVLKNNLKIMKNVVVQVLNNFCRSCRKLLAAGSMSCIVAFPISGAKQNTQTTNFVGHPDRHTWQYCQSL
jgi:Na+-translocating ferredoxin:NAD+ oxidoreductase RNF subunit RnfB